MLKKEEILLIIYFILVILLLVFILVIFFYIFQKRKNRLLFEKWEEQKRYEEEIVKSKMEIQEQTLKNVGQELHDNIGQLLSVVKMQLNILATKVEVSNQAQLTEISENVGSTLYEVRSLSKSLNNEVVEHVGLETSLENELKRFQSLKALKTSFKTEGEKIAINHKETIIIFRIIQEFFSNIIKHARATEIALTMSYTTSAVKIEVVENGIGFKPEEVEKSSGLINMKSRADLIGADFQLTSQIGEGTKLIILYPIKI